jgi:hypothetical protein
VPSVENKAAPGNRKDDPTGADWTERIIFAVVVTVIAVVPTLTFVFSFGNVGDLGVSLHVDPRIAFLTGPAIDLSVVGLIVAGSYLSHRGWSEKQLWPIHLMSVICGLTMIALNCGQAVYQTRWRLAAFDAVGPLLLIGWGFIGPWLLRQLFEARTVPAMHSASDRKDGASESGVQPNPHAHASESTTASTASTAPHPNASPAESRPASTTRPAVSRANGAGAASRSGSGPIPIQRADRLKIVAELIEDVGGDYANLPLKVIEQRFGVSQPTASRMRTDASKLAPAKAQGTAEDEPERAWAVNS